MTHKPLRTRRFADPVQIRRALQEAGEDKSAERMLRQMEQHGDHYFSSERL